MYYTFTNYMDIAGVKITEYMHSLTTAWNDQI